MTDRMIPCRILGGPHDGETFTVARHLIGKRIAVPVIHPEPWRPVEPPSATLETAILEPVGVRAGVYVYAWPKATGKR